MAYIPLTQQNVGVGESESKPNKQDSELVVGTTPLKIEDRHEFSLTPKFLVKQEDDTVPKKVLKAIGRFVAQPIINVAEDVSAYHAAHELIRGVEKGEYPIEILEEFNKFNDTKKSNLQFFGSLFEASLLAVPGAKTQQVIASQLVQKSLPLLSRMAQGAIRGLKDPTFGIIGGAFGLANTLAEQSDPTPEELALGTGAGVVGGQLAGGAIEALSPAISQGLSSTWCTSKGLLSKLLKSSDDKVAEEVSKKAAAKISGVPIEVPEKSLVQKAFPKLYENSLLETAKKELGEHAVEVSPKLNVFQKLVAGGTPIRKLTETDPQASFIRMELENGVIAQKQAYSKLRANESLKILQKADKELMSKAVGFQESGRPTEEAPPLVKDLVKYIRNLETQTYNFARDILKVDVGQWRFDPNNHFAHVFTGSQVLFEEVPSTAAGKFVRKPLAFAEDRIDGLRKLLELHEKHPTRKFILRPRTDLAQSKVPPTALEAKSFFAFINKLANHLEVTPQEALEEVSMQGIARIKPKKTKIGTLLFRKGEISDYTTDPMKVYPSIWAQMTKKAYIDPITRKTSMRLSKISDATVQSNLKDLISVVSGEFQNQALDYNVTSKLLGFNARMKLGYRISPVLVNSLQRLYGVATSGFKNFASAQKDIFTKEGQRILEKVGVSTDVLFYEPKLTGLQPQLRKIDPLYMFGRSEGGKYVGTRSTVALANYKTGLELPLNNINRNMKKLGLPTWASQDELAVDFARQATHATQFVYGVEGVPQIMRKNLGRWLLQFKSYGLNLLSNIPNIVTGKPLPGTELFYPQGLSKQQAMRQAIVYFGTMFTQGGLKALGFGMERFLPAATLVYLAAKAPHLLFGLAGFLGIDISSSASVEFTNLSSLLPYDDAKTVWEAIKNKDPKYLTKLNPAAFRIYRALEAAIDENNLKDFDTGYNIMKLTPVELWMYATGLTPLRVAQESQIHRYTMKIHTDLNELTAKGKNDIIMALKGGDFEAARNIYSNLLEDGIEIKGSELVESFKKSELTRIQRDFLVFRKKRREQFLDLVGDFIRR